MGTAIEKEAPVTARTAPPAASSWDTACLNCGSSLTGPFCAECGQRAIPPHPTLRELAGEAFVEFSGWDGKLAETIRALIRKPGKLTIEFLEGRRARYISPLRLYLTASVVYFVLAAASPEGTSEKPFFGIKPIPKGVTVKTDPVDKNGNIDPFSTSQGRVQGLDGLDPETRAQVVAQIESAPKLLRPIFRRAVASPKQFQSDVLASMPKALFALLPVFAGIVALFYRGRRFADHLYFALHVHAFAFVALSLNEAAKFTQWFPLVFLGGVTVLLWLPLYTHWSLRRVYGGSQLGTLLNELGIGALYCAASIPALVALAYWVAVRSA